MSLINQFRSAITKALVNLGPAQQSNPSHVSNDRPRGNLFAKARNCDAMPVRGAAQNSDQLNILLAGLQSSFNEVY